MNWLYLALNLGSIAIPFAFSFEKKISFYKKWYALFPALIITAAFFTVWDIWFTNIGIWKFNPDFIIGFHLANLPIEEWMFFLFIPYSCLFIHESLKYYFSTKSLPTVAAVRFALFLGFFCIATGILNYHRMYTAVTFTLTGCFLLALVFLKKKEFLARFFLTYFVSLLPFAVVNGVLTGMPVLIYNNSHNLSVRVGTIPVEDFFYSMLLILMNICIYEYRLSPKNVTP